MRVILDFTQIPLDRTGVGVYGDHLLENLKHCLNSDDSLILVVQSDDLRIREAVEDCPKISLVTIPSRVFRNRLLLLAFEQLILPMLALTKRADLIHSLHYTHPIFSRTPRAVTIHDLTFILFPELHTFGRRLIMPFFIRHAMKHAEAVIFVSDASRDDAERLLPAGNNLRSVVPLGVLMPSVDSMGIKPSESVLASLNVNTPYVLFIGTLEPRKNIVRLVQAFERIARDRPVLRLVIAGKLGWNTDQIVEAIHNSPVHSQILRLGFVSDADKSMLLQHCAMLVYPSLYEGFGLPVLEAMAAGAPVITSNISSMPEVAGDAALLVDPTSVDAIAAAMEQLLSSQTLSEQLRVSGPYQAANFRWSRTAELTYATYQSVLLND